MTLKTFTDVDPCHGILGPFSLPFLNIAPENGGPPGKGDSELGNHHF